MRVKTIQYCNRILMKGAGLCMVWALSPWPVHRTGTRQGSSPWRCARHRPQPRIAITICPTTFFPTRVLISVGRKRCNHANNSVVNQHSGDPLSPLDRRNRQRSDCNRIPIWALCRIGQNVDQKRERGRRRRLCGDWLLLNWKSTEGVAKRPEAGHSGHRKSLVTWLVQLCTGRHVLANPRYYLTPERCHTSNWILSTNGDTQIVRWRGGSEFLKR